MAQLQKNLKKHRIHHGVYVWTDTGGTIRNDVPTMIYRAFKSINPVTSIGVSNLKDEIDKSNLDKFGNIVKYLLDDMSSKYSIFLDKGEHHEDDVRHIYRNILSVPNSTFIRLI